MVSKLIQFPPPKYATPDGLIYLGGELTVENLLAAYQQGIFPWPHEGLPLLWFTPPERGILAVEKFHVSRSFQKFLKKTSFKITRNQAFEKVIEACAEVPRAGVAGGTWILPEMKRVYTEFFKAGYAFSLECWSDQELVGGLYGVQIGGYVSGESMFHIRDHASKFCLYTLISEMKKSGQGWLDIQMVTPALKDLGGEYISRNSFLERLRSVIKKTQPKSDQGR